MAVPTSNRFIILQENEDEKSEDKSTDAVPANDDTTVSVHAETATDSNACTDADANRAYDKEIPKRQGCLGQGFFSL